MSVAETSSRIWSCSTLRDGMEDVVHKQKELEDEENELQRQIEELEGDAGVSTEDTQVVNLESDAERGPLPAEPDAETQKASDEEVQRLHVVPTMPPTKEDKDASTETQRPVPTPARAEDPATAATPEASDSTATPAVAKKRTRQEKLREAAKQRIRRMIAAKKRAHLNCPEFVKEEWKNKDQNSMAQILMDANWDKDVFINQLEILVKSKKTLSIRVEEQWITEKEMRTELHWTPARIAGAKKTCEAKAATHTRRNAYDNEPEFYVIVKEVGSREFEKTQEEIQRTLKKADGETVLDKDVFSGLDQIAARQAADEAVAADPKAAANSQALETKTTFSKFMQSMLQKSGKIRGLVRDLRDNYAQCESNEQNIKKLQDGLQKLDLEYDKCTTVMAEGELSNYGDEFVKKANTRIKDSTYVCSNVCAMEMKIRNEKKYYQKNAHEPGSAEPETKRKKDKKDKKDADGSEPKPEKAKKSKNDQ